MTNRPYPIVPRKFDEQLEALISFVGQHGPTSVNVEQLAADLAAQREQTQRDLELARQAAGYHESFMIAQGERYKRFMMVLRQLRLAHADDPNARTALEQFKRKTRRTGTSDAVDSEAA